MAKDEIKIETFKLKEYNGNLKNLSSAWHSMPKFTNRPMRVSQGSSSTGSADGSAAHINDTCEEAVKLTKTVGVFLDNTVGFFEEMGISFVDTDESAANAIGSGSGGGHF